MQKAANYMRGSAVLEAVGPYPERFLNICAARGIRFWHTEQVDETTLRVTVPLSQARAAIRLGPRCLCEVSRVRVTGAPDFLLRFRRRYGMLAGLALSLLAVLVLSRFVLVIEVTGSETVPDGVILSELREIGLYPGVYGPSVDERAISNQALLDLEELGFLSVNIKGVRAQVVVRDKDPVPDIEPTGVGRDLVASKSGLVLRVWPLAGTAQVSTGALVSAGDVLISGNVTVYATADPEQVLSSYDVLAKGEVWAQVEETFSASTPLSCTGKEYTGRTRTRRSLTILGHTFKISAKAFQPFPCYDKIESVRSLRLSDTLTLPLSLTVTECQEYTPVELPVNRDSAETYLRDLLEARLAQAVGEQGQIQQEDWTVTEEDGVLTLQVTARCLEQIALAE